MPQFQLGGEQLIVAEELRLLGVVIRSDMKWASNTEYICKRASKKLWILRRLKCLGANSEQLLDIYGKQVRSLVEFAVPAWHGAITVVEKQDIERIQKVALHIILGENYDNYLDALKVTKLEPLEKRRDKLCLKFARKAEKSEKFKMWFKAKPKIYTRQADDKYWKAVARTGRLQKSSVSYLTNLLNSFYKK